ncbi:uncharacterized protein LOC115053358 [Echeneis naucrates]|uniref:Uncharacterized LOC115053358 n=1 Tax=Echeneis naucrates TaxID=173247 RepID=A0A665UYN2_ECHNA|nr:uncharacterized protein LOC115053358 [Echeneis naucrates]
MHNNYLLGAISCLFILPAGLCAEECQRGILAKRNTFHVEEGKSLSLSCEVQECGDTWTWSWICKTSTDKDYRDVTASPRHQLTSEKLSGNITRLVLNFLRVNSTDEGYYGCKVVWHQDGIDLGHQVYVNITAAAASQRALLHRVWICTSVLLCLSIIIALACCLSSKVKHQSPIMVFDGNQAHLPPEPPPRCPVPEEWSSSSHKVSCKPQQTEVLYADISKDALWQRQEIRQPAPSTVYSMVQYSKLQSQHNGN